VIYNFNLHFTILLRLKRQFKFNGRLNNNNSNNTEFQYWKIKISRFEFNHRILRQLFRVTRISVPNKNNYTNKRKENKTFFELFYIIRIYNELYFKIKINKISSFTNFYLFANTI